MAFQGSNWDLAEIWVFAMKIQPKVSFEDKSICVAFHDSLLSIERSEPFSYTTRQAKKTDSISLWTRRNPNWWRLNRVDVNMSAVTNRFYESNFCHWMDDDFKCLLQWIVYNYITNCSLFAVKHSILRWQIATVIIAIGIIVRLSSLILITGIRVPSTAIAIIVCICQRSTGVFITRCYWSGELLVSFRLKMNKIGSQLISTRVILAY